MLDSLKSGLKLSMSADQGLFAASDNRQATRFLLVVIVPGIVALAVELLFEHVWPRQHTPAIEGVLVGMLITALAVLLTLWRGSIVAAGIITVTLTWLGGAIMMWLGEGARDPVVLLEILAILIAGLLGWPSFAILLTIATIGYSAILGVLEHRGTYAFTQDHPLNIVRDLAILILVIGIVILLYARGMRSARTQMMHEWARRMRDEQERKQLLEWEREARAQAEHANLAKDRFIATLSHELRTPLTPVLMSLSVMESDQALTPVARQEARVMRQNIQIEMRLIDDLLDLSRATFGKLRLERRPFCISDIVDDVVRICRPELDERCIHLVRQAAIGRVQMVGDADRMRQVFWNILRNAIRFTPERGTISVHTNLASTEDGLRYRIQISDSGPGIDPELMPRLFNQFEQGKASQNSGGLGLGLAISRTIVHGHSGGITAANSASGGAVFTVELPCTAQQVAGPTMPPEPAADQPMRALRILFVEDDRLTGAVFTRCLSSMGHSVDRASSLESARTILRDKHDHDLLISDIGLPDGSGLELMPLFADACSAPGISLSGFGADQDIAASRAAGFSIHLIKPVNLTQLRAAIANAMHGGNGSAGGLQPADPVKRTA